MDKRSKKKAPTSSNSDSLLETDMLKVSDVSVILMVLAKQYCSVVRLLDYQVSVMFSSSGNLNSI